MTFSVQHLGCLESIDVYVPMNVLVTHGMGSDGSHCFPRVRAEGLDPHSVPMRWVERDPSGPLYDLLADPIGGDALGGARKPQRWSKVS